MKRAGDSSDGAPTWLVYTALTLLAGAVLAVGWWAVFNLSAPQTLKVPEIVGMSFSEASTHLDQMHLKLRKFREEASEDYPEGVVLSVDPAVGRDVKEFSFVNAVVSSGSRFVEVPDLQGRTVEDARRLLTSVGLKLGANVQHVYSDSVESGFIVSQRPAKHVQVDRHSSVTIEVSNGPRTPDPVEVPPAQDFVYHLSWQMHDAADDIRVRVEMTDMLSTRIVYEQTHSPNDTVEIDVEGSGEEATFMIFYDDRLVKTVTQRAGEQAQPFDDDDGDLAPTDGGQ